MGASRLRAANMEPMAGTVVVLGQGYVGLPVAVRAAEVGFDVVGFDVDAAKVKQLAAGTSHVEDIPDDRLEAALASGRYRASCDPADLAGFDVAVISVPTPLNEHQPDLSFIESAARTIGPHVSRECTVVLESTTYPGTTEELVGPILEELSGLAAGTDFHLGYSPERIDPGNPSWRFENTPKVVSGIDAASLDAVDAFFRQLVAQTVRVRGTREAELTKLLENTFRHVNIALVNELAMFAYDLGIDVWDAIDAAATKPFGFMRFTPGPGVGGHCLPIDPSYLSWQVRRSLGQAFRFVELANDINDHMPDYVVRRLIAGLNRRGLAVRDRRILLLGLSYKKGTGDAREAPSRRVAQLLLELGADVRAADPYVSEEMTPPGVRRVAGDGADLADADAIVLLVDHEEFDVEQLAELEAYVLDCRRVSRSADIERL
jgi:UDP-N-acetyl-D-glucosamine dehydrogenase